MRFDINPAKFKNSLIYNQLRHAYFEAAAENIFKCANLSLHPVDFMPYSKCIYIDENGRIITLEVEDLE